MVDVVALLVSRHSCVADRLPVVVRSRAGPRVSLKTVDPPKGNGLGQKNISMCRRVWASACGMINGKPPSTEEVVIEHINLPFSSAVARFFHTVCWAADNAS